MNCFIVGEEIKQQYQQLAQALDEFVRKVFNEWTATVEKDTGKLLDTALMARNIHRLGLLDLHFDKTLLKLFQEINYWERLMFEIPHYAADVYSKREELRVLRENVLLVVRDYNRIIAVLSPEERALFKERIRFLDKKIHPGLSKLTWASKGVSEYFINDCRVNSNKVQLIVDNYKSSNVLIQNKCRSISETLLIKIDGKRVYDDLDFDEEQREYRKHTQQRLLGIHEHIIETMKKIYEVFKNDNMEVIIFLELYFLSLTSFACNDSWKNVYLIF